MTLTNNANPIAGEKDHWYDKSGKPAYEVEAKKGGMRATRIDDARKLDLVPSVTKILSVVARPGLEIWKQRKMLEAALTLPRSEGEDLETFANRVIADSKEQSKQAADRGTRLHTAIENYIRTGEVAEEWREHLDELVKTLQYQNINIMDGEAEHTFAHPLGYGGKTDWRAPMTVLDFKSKDRIDPKDKLVYDEHAMQLAAYASGVSNAPLNHVRTANVFVGVEDKRVVFLEHSWNDLERAWQAFRLILEYWQRVNRYGPFKEEK